jgi:cytoskeletal protein RodZ
MESLGAYLLRKREERGMSVSEVARETRIQARILGGLEHDDWEDLPHATFVKGFVRNICRSLEVSDTRALELYDEQVAAHRARPTPSLAEITPTEAPPEQNQAAPAPRLRVRGIGKEQQIGPTLIAVVVLLVVAMFFFAVKITGSSNPDPQTPSYTWTPAVTGSQGAFSEKASE